MSGLRPCPLCGGDARLAEADSRVNCADVGCPMHYVAVRLDDWQDRPTERALRLACEMVADVTGECPHSMLLEAPRDCENECAEGINYAECWRMRFEKLAKEEIWRNA